MRVARLVARAIGWLFVGVIAYHAVLAVIEGVQAADDGNWTHAAELIAIAVVAASIVVAAIVAATRSASRSR
jgi:hypothetical protein